MTYNSEIAYLCDIETRHFPADSRLLIAWLTVRKKKRNCFPLCDLKNNRQIQRNWIKYQVQLKVQNNLIPHLKEVILRTTLGNDVVNGDCTRKAPIDLSMLCVCVSSAMVWVHPPLPQRDDKQQGWLHVPGHQRCPKNTNMYQRIEAKKGAGKSPKGEH